MQPFTNSGRSLFWRLFFCLFVLFSYRLADAQPLGAEKEFFTYRIQPNDTLIQLATDYTLDANNWRTLQDLNGVEDPYRLPIGKVISIPFSLIPVRPSEGVLVHTQGNVQLNGSTASVEDIINSGDSLSTGVNSFATVQLEDNSSISLPANSTLLFKQINQFEGVPLSDVIFELSSGTVETQAAPQGQGVGRYEIHTPVSITGVRGTRLRISSAESGSRTELLQGQAHIEADHLAPHMLRAQQGAALDQSGALQVAELLDAPRIRTAQPHSGGIQVELEPLSGAQHYQVLMTSDPQGHRIIHSAQFTEPQFFLAPVQAGTHYAFIRGIDAQGFAGLDTNIDFPGRRVLLSADGRPVRTAFGQVVFSGTP